MPVRMCDASFGNIYRWDGDALNLVATHNTPPSYAEVRAKNPFHANDGTAVGRMIRSLRCHFECTPAAVCVRHGGRRDHVKTPPEHGGVAVSERPSLSQM
jgi:hypothetical protein